VGKGGSIERSEIETGEGLLQNEAPPLTRLASLGTLSHKGRGKKTYAAASFFGGKRP
jgi:hypothetical protein